MDVIEAIFLAVFAFALSALSSFLFGFTFMLWMGVAHGYESWIPAPGYWASFFLVWALSAPVSSVVTANNSLKDS